MYTSTSQNLFCSQNPSKSNIINTHHTGSFYLDKESLLILKEKLKKKELVQKR